jgi:hypothetical protein
MLCPREARESSTQGEGMAWNGGGGSDQVGLGKFRIGHLRFTRLCWKYAGSWGRRSGKSD